MATKQIAHADGREAFETSQVSGVLRSVVDQVNFYDGQFLNFTANENIIIDMSGNPYVTFDVKVQPGAAYLTTVAGVVDTTKIDSVPFFGITMGTRYSRRIEASVLAINKKYQQMASGIRSDMISLATKDSRFQWYSFGQ
ncbi:MAG: hypothetical protein IPO94_11355 [Saprospiraceae bacterium]|nr:hypothetical protein [Saprospiraceae bacterium]